MKPQSNTSARRSGLISLSKALWLLVPALALICPATATAESPDLSGTYRLKTKFRGADECLEGNQAGSSVKGGAAFMDKCQNVTGQIWKITATGDGYYRLQTQFRGTGESLEGNQAGSPVKGGAAFMDKVQSVSGQLWKLVPTADGYYRLQTKFRGDGECLEGNEAASPVHGGAAFMNKCQEVTGQLWKLEKLPTAAAVAPVKSKIATCRTGLNLLVNNPYAYPAKPDQAANGKRSWNDVYGDFKKNYLPACNDIGSLLQSHADGPAWNEAFTGRSGIVPQGDRIPSYCPNLHRSQFDCVSATARINSGAVSATKILGLLDIL